MNEVIFNHKSIRKFQPTLVPDSLLDEIVEAGTRASTTGNMQVYSIIISRDAGIRDQLWASHFKQEMVRQAPVHLTFCADFNRFSQWCKMRGAVPGYNNFLSFFTAAIDALLVAQNVALAAESHGLGICYLGTVTYMAEKFVEILRLPKLVVPVAAIVLGYPDEDPMVTDRLPLGAITHSEVYQDYTPDEINCIYEDKEGLELYQRLVEENNLPSLAHIFTDKRYTQKDNEYFSEAFLNVIRKQGFSF